MGTKFPAGVSPVYPPRDWICPECKKYHSKPHFAFPGQVDFSKKPAELGRVKWNREGSGMDCGLLKADMPTKETKDKTGPMLKRGLNQPLFCPHCGWVDKLIRIVAKTKASGKGLRRFMKKDKCCLKGCPNVVAIRYGKLGIGVCKKHKDVEWGIPTEQLI